MIIVCRFAKQLDHTDLLSVRQRVHQVDFGRRTKFAIAIIEELLQLGFKVTDRTYNGTDVLEEYTSTYGSQVREEILQFLHVQRQLEQE